VRLLEGGQRAGLDEVLVDAHQAARVARGDVGHLLDLLNAYAELANGESSLAAAEVDRALARYRISYTTGPFAPAFDGPFAGLPAVPAPEPARVPPFARAPGMNDAAELAVPAARPAAEPAPASQPAPAAPGRQNETRPRR
jgi:hypothetical protein